jgi:ElaB/YqjD/DUF883 family membrane-anchored ribosome-binding protein
MSTFEKYVNEMNSLLNERSINKIQTEFTDVVNKMATMAKEYATATGDERANILAELKGLTTKKNNLVKELDAAVAGKDKDVQLVVNEDLQEAYGKPAGLTKEETLKIAQKFADAMSKIEGNKVTVNKRTLEEDSFDLDVDGEEFEGGSYNIYQNGNVMNMAVPSNPIYGKKNDTVDTIAKNMKKAFTNESFLDASDKNSEELDEAKGFKNTKNFQDFLEEIDSMPESTIKKIMGKDYIDTPGGYKDEAEDYDNDIMDYMLSNMGSKEFQKLQDWWETNVAESIVIESKKFYNTKEIVKIANNAGDWVLDAKSAIQDLSVSYGDKVPTDKLDKVLANYDLELEDVLESVITEGRKVILKRQYTENNPAKTVGKTANVRNKVLEFIKNGKITKEAFENFVAGLSNNSKRWTKNNAHYFTISEEGVSLSKIGQKLLKSITVNEATAKNPGVWVPGNFEKDIAKYPNNKITRKLVLDAAKKWDVNPEDAIKYVEFGWAVDLSENKNNNVNTKFIYESFQEFVKTKLNEGILNEAFASAKLASLLTGANAMPKDLPKAFYNMSKLALDKIQDIDIIEMTPDQAKKEKRASAVYLYFTTNEKENPYAGKSTYNGKTIPANTLLAITDGSNEWMNAEWSRHNRRQTQKDGRVLTTTKRDDSAGISKSGASDQYGTGISSMKQVAELADRAYCLDLTILKARYSTEAQRAERVEAKKGATAIMDPRAFKDANKQRYNEILATKASAMPMDSIVLGAIDTLSEQIKDAIAKGTQGKYGDILIGTDQRGKEVKLNDASSLMRNILDEYSRYCGSVSQNEQEKAAGYGGNYYEGAMKQHAKNITDYVKKIETKSYGW